MILSDQHLTQPGPDLEEAAKTLLKCKNAPVLFSHLESVKIPDKLER